MGLFDKKYCDVCGEKISLLGNRKLEDGNLCKDCAKKLSPFFSERRSSTVAEIKEQLAYREENERRLADFRPDMTFNGSKNVYVDRAGARFIVTSSSNWRNANPDLISFSQVTGVNTNIEENKTEIYYKDEEGNRKSYTPRRYECTYEFNVTILVNSPWFDKIELELSDGNRPDSPYTDLYRRYEQQMHTLADVLSGKQTGAGAFGQNSFAAPSAPKTREQEIMDGVIKDSTWACKKCGFINRGTFNCQNCGGPVSDETVLSAARNIAKATLMSEGGAFAQGGYNQQQAGYNQPQGGYSQPQGGFAAAPQGVSQNWVCPSCGSQNTGKFCENCGTPNPGRA